MNKLRITSKYGIAPNELLYKKELSLKAKGLFTYLQAKPDGWKFDVKRIGTEVKDNRDSISAGLKELEDHGYLERKPRRGDDGKWDGYDYHLHEKPLTEKPLSENPLTEKPLTEKPSPYIKKDNIKQDNKKKDIAAKAADFSFEEKLKIMEKDKDKRMNIISTYWKRKGWKFETKDKYDRAIRREVIAAGNLKPYSLEQIEETMDYIEGLEYLSRWTLETVFKYIDEVTNIEIEINNKQR